jgi:hypothetical protein
VAQASVAETVLSDELWDELEDCFERTARRLNGLPPIEARQADSCGIGTDEGGR